MTRLARFGWGVLVYNLGVIAWGAYVRATGSGAGCGAHWPLCNGEVIPQAPSAEMLVEFSHRATAGLALISVVALVAWAWRACEAGHPARRSAAWAMVFMLTEAGLGAGLVLFQLVADNASTARAMLMSAHLVNAFLLLASLALTAYWLSGGERVQVAGRGGLAARFAVGAVAFLLAGISGAIAALGDTLYPARSLAEALGTDLSPTSHLLVRLRLLHPSLTVIVASGLMMAGGRYAYAGQGVSRRLGVGVAVVALVQALFGFLNVVLLAPVWMQVVHLLVADLLWIGFVLLAASAMSRGALSR